MAGMTPTSSEALAATRKASACWIDLGAGARLVWHLWHDHEGAALWLVCGGAEQDLPGAGTATEATVTVRTRTGQVERWQGTVTRHAPGSEAWVSVVPALHDKRCNAPDGEDQPLRWARESVVLKVSPA